LQEEEDGLRSYRFTVLKVGQKTIPMKDRFLKKEKDMRSSLILLMVVVSFFFTLVPKARADDQEKTYKGIGYVCAGVGDSKDDPRWKAYPLKLMFTTGARAYVAQVDVTLQDASGAEVLKVNCDAPWLLAKLKPGTYSVTARADGGGTKTAKVTVPASGQNELAIRFPAIPEGKGNDSY
jgi:hypothetical protein